MPDGTNSPMADGTETPDALPQGLVPLPEFGPGVVGTRVAAAARWVLWTKAAVWVGLALLATVFSVQSAGFLGGLLLGVALAAACGFMAAGSLALVSLGSRPALIVDETSLRCDVPLSRCSVELAAITRVDRLRRDLLVEARGGIERNGRPTRARWVAVSGADTFEVSRADLVAHLTARAAAARAAAAPTVPGTDGSGSPE